MSKRKIEQLEDENATAVAELGDEQPALYEPQLTEAEETELMSEEELKELMEVQQAEVESETHTNGAEALGLVAEDFILAQPEGKAPVDVAALQARIAAVEPLAKKTSRGTSGATLINGIELPNAPKSKQTQLRRVVNRGEANLDVVVPARLVQAGFKPTSEGGPRWRLIKTPTPQIVLETGEKFEIWVVSTGGSKDYYLHVSAS